MGWTPQLCLASFSCCTGVNRTPKRAALWPCCVFFSTNEKVLIAINKQEKGRRASTEQSSVNSRCVSVCWVGGTPYLNTHTHTHTHTHTQWGHTSVTPVQIPDSGEEKALSPIPPPNPSRSTFLFLFQPTTHLQIPILSLSCCRQSLVEVR